MALVEQLGVAVVSLIVGWAALWPSRHRLGPLTYHLVAMPVGLLAWPLAGAFSNLVGRDFDVITVAVGAALVVALLVFFQRLDRDSGPPAGDSVSPMSYGVMAAALLVFGGIFTRLGLGAVNNDSVASFWPLGVVLERLGTFKDSLMSVRAPLLTNMNAGHVLFGAEWAYVIYPLLAVSLLAYLLGSLLVGPLAGRSRSVRIAVTGAIVVFLMTEPSFLLHSIYAHSHMITALYLLIALSELWAASPPTAHGEPSNPSTHARLVVAGAAAAGIALARPDGLAYAFIPIIFAIGVVTQHKVTFRNVGAFFGPMIAIVLVPYVSAYATLGMWGGGKLTGRRAMIVLIPFCLSVVAPWVVSWLSARLPVRVSGWRFLYASLLGATGLLIIGHVLRWSNAKMSAMNAAINLFAGAGGYAHLWYAVLLLLILSLITKDALTLNTWTQPAFAGVVLYAMVVTLVHGMVHPGRVGSGDTMTRMVFQMIPLVAWFAGAIAARIFSPDASVASAEQP